MCGIAGIVQREPAPLPREGLLRQMLAMLRHRGPDQFGIGLDRHAALGSARLSILDLECGRQPIANEDYSLWIVFNGEIFNHVELRADLQARGHRFRTRTDTEVVLHSYEEYGPACLERFNGQFAIAIWDARKQELFLARDRLGVRPLFYAEAHNRLIFASEIKAILVTGLISAALDLRTLEQIFTYWSPLPPRTAFQNIRELPPGHYLLARDGRITLRRYWELRFSADGDSPPAASLASRVEEFSSLLTDAVRLRLRADVPIGAYLSGGLDSAVVAALASRLGARRLDTFSIAFSDKTFDESSYQQQMARFLGTQHQVVVASHADIGRVFPEVIWHTETPVLRTAPAPMFLLSQLAHSQNYKVVLTGEGADEFLAGYDIFKEAMVRRFWARCPQSQWRPLLLQRLYPDIPALARTTTSYLQAFFGIGLSQGADPYFSHTVRWQNTRRIHRFFSEEFKLALAQGGDDAGNLPALPPQFAGWSSLAKAQYLEASIFLSHYLLCSQGDRPAMAHSVEARFPFLDVRLIEFCNRLPHRFKLNGLTEKFLLRQAARQWLPAEVCTRPKKPYRAPIHRSFFHGSTPDYVSDLLGDKALAETALFRAEAVRRLRTRILQGEAVGETDDMALAGILSTQLLHWLFVARFQGCQGLSERDDVKVLTIPRLSPDNLPVAQYQQRAWSEPEAHSASASSISR